MLAAALLSMWISNSATALMLLPVAMAISPPHPKFQSRLLLGIAYACSIGGIGTPIGTPPNLIFMEIYRANTGVDVSFLQWMIWTVPILMIMLPAAACCITWRLPSTPLPELPPLPAWRSIERRVLLIFAATAALWITRTQPWGGWSALLKCPEADDAAISLLATIVLFIVPSGDGRKLLDWPTASQIQWGILLLFGGGLAISKAFVVSGLSESLGNAMATVSHGPLLLTIGLVCLGVTFLTEITSNTATASLLMPTLAAAAQAANLEPAALMVPAVISVSFAFMLPIATPPNAIVMAGTEVRVADMARAGLILNLIGVVIVTAVCYTIFR
jgi:sodium-dependent dicarboxylate transporter 2/3/5